MSSAATIFVILSIAIGMVFGLSTYAIGRNPYAHFTSYRPFHRHLSRVN
jgi:hypothetical protein